MVQGKRQLRQVELDILLSEHYLREGGQGETKLYDEDNDDILQGGEYMCEGVFES